MVLWTVTPQARAVPRRQCGHLLIASGARPALSCLLLHSLQPCLCTIARVWKVLPSFPGVRPTGLPRAGSGVTRAPVLVPLLPSALPPHEGQPQGLSCCGVWAFPGVPAPLGSPPHMHQLLQPAGAVWSSCTCPHQLPLPTAGAARPGSERPPRRGSPSRPPAQHLTLEADLTKFDVKNSQDPGQTHTLV